MKLIKMSWGEKMNLKKRNIALLLFAALVLGFIGSYVGVKIATPGNVTEQEQAPINDSGEIELNMPAELDKVTQAFDLIKQHYLEDVEDEKLVEGAIHGMLETLEDPYSTYMDPETMERFTEQIESSFEGIGAEVSMVDGKVTIIAPIKDSPAEEVGLRTNDQIIRIDDESLDGLDLNEAVEKIRGEKGSTVLLKIERPGTSEPFDIEIVRDEIPIETVFGDIEEIDNKKTGIIEITSFAETTASDFETELTRLEDEGIEGLIIDVRGNPGGLLNSVEEILANFVPKDMPYIQTENKEGEKTPYYSNLAEKKEYPISVLIDEGSASASEILAVALKEMDYDVIGMPSFGKGTVQEAVPLGDGSTIKLTLYKWLSPEGNWIHEIGVEPTTEQKQPDYYYSNPILIENTYSLNDQGEQVENIQQILIGIGYEIENVDGVYDKQTEAAVTEFQKDNDIKSSGQVDERTAELMEVKIIEKIRNGVDDLQLEKAFDVLYK